MLGNIKTRRTSLRLSESRMVVNIKGGIGQDELELT
jgi:hypothetical protein